MGGRTSCPCGASWSTTTCTSRPARPRPRRCATSPMNGACRCTWTTSTMSSSSLAWPSWSSRPGELATALCGAFAAKYEGYTPTPDDWGPSGHGGLARIDPQTVLAWRDMPTATRWRLGARHSCAHAATARDAHGPAPSGTRIAGDYHRRRGRHRRDRRRHRHDTPDPRRLRVTQAIDRPTAAGAPEAPTFRHFIAGEWCDVVIGRRRSRAATRPIARDVIGRFQQGTAGRRRDGRPGGRDGAARCGARRRPRSAARSSTASAR